MGHYHLYHLDLKDEYKLYCGHCHTQLCYNFEIISTDYKCKNGKALFVSTVRNVAYGQVHQTCLTSGSYDVHEMFCLQCNQELGWKYLKAYQEQNEYKEERFLLDCSKIY